MGNAASTQPGQHQPHAQQPVDLQSGRKHDQPSASSEFRHVARYVAPNSPQTQRIVVDIRSSDPDRDRIRQETPKDLDMDIRSVWGGLQAIGGLLITVLTIQKLWEDIRFVRLLQRELSTLVGSLTDPGSGALADDGEGDGDPPARPPRPRPRTSGRPVSPSSAPPPSADSSTRPFDLDTCLGELSDLLGGKGGTENGRGQGRARRGRSKGGGEGEGGGAGGAALSASERLSLQQQEAAAAGKKEVTWAAISGLTDVKMLLQEATVLPTLRPDLFQGIRSPPRALLLFGPPGTGKTLLARVVAAESGAAFFPVTGSSVLSMWYGQSEQNVRALFERARKRQPAIIFIDEVDSLLGRRGGGEGRDSGPDKRVTNEFLAFMDGIQTQQGQGQQQGAGAATGAAGGRGGGGGSGGGGGGDSRVIVIAATNAPWDLDEAALSRFSRRIYVPLPDIATREALMRRAMQGVSCALTDPEWRRLAERSEHYSGRDLVQLCREAAMRPLRELWGRQLLEADPPASPSPSASSPAVAAAAASSSSQVPGASASASASATTAPVPAPHGDSGNSNSSSGDGGGGGGGVPTAAPPAPPLPPPPGGRHAAAHQRLVELVAASLVGAAAPGGGGQQAGGQQQAGGSVGGGGAGGGGEKGEGRTAAAASPAGAGAGAGEADTAAGAKGAEGVGAGATGVEGAAAAAGRCQGTGEAAAAAVQAAAGPERGRCGGAAGGGGGRRRWWAWWQWGSGDRYARSKKQARRELSRWRARHGAAWVDVEAVMRQAEQLAEATMRGGGGGGAAQRQAEVAGQRQQQDGEGQQQHEAGAQQHTAGQAERGEQQRQEEAGQQQQRQEASSTAGGQPEATEPGTREERAAGARQQAQAASDAAEGQPVGAAAAPPASPTTPPAPSPACCSTSAPAGDDPAAAVAAAAAHSDSTPAPAPAPAPAGAPLAASPAPDAAASTAPGHPSAPPPTPPPAASKPCAATAPTAAATTSSVSPSPPSASQPAPPLAASLQQLLALPACRVRQVTAADMEAALQVISCTEMDQSARYREWDRQWGSGAEGAGGRHDRGRGASWQAMYV